MADEAFTATEFVVLDSRSLKDTVRSIQEIFDGISPDEFMATLAELRKE